MTTTQSTGLNIDRQQNRATSWARPKTKLEAKSDPRTEAEIETAPAPTPTPTAAAATTEVAEEVATAPDQATIRYVAIGDSFTEGVGDDLPDGGVRGWADLVAQGLADATGQPVQYANLAIRGRLLEPIIHNQLEPALALGPTLISFNGGGNDLLRPSTNIPWIVGETERALRHMLDNEVTPLLLAGANPTVGIPRGKAVQTKGDALTLAAQDLADRLGISMCDNWSDPVLAKREYWSADRLHLAPVGHARVASNVLRTLGHDIPSDWVIDAAPKPRPTRREDLRYTREHVLPWVKRRITRRSSGDGRSAKYPEFVWVEPRR